MEQLQVSATFPSISPDAADQFKQLAADALATVRGEPGTLQHDWFFSDDGAQCVVRETYASSDAFLAHLVGAGPLLGRLLELGGGLALELFGEPSVALRDAVADFQPRICVMADEMVKILNGNTFVVSDQRGDIEAFVVRPDRAVLIRHPVLVEVAAHCERGPSDLAVDRRPPVLRGAVLPRSRGWERLRERHPLGDPPACGRQRLSEELSILNHDDAPVDLARANRCRLRLRGSVRGQGRAAEEGLVREAGRRGVAPSDLYARHLRTVDGHLVVAALRARRDRDDVQDHHWGTRDLDDRA